MFELGWTELAVIALVALIVIGPKDLPAAMRTVGHWVRRARSLTREFQSGLDEMMRESELDEARKSIESTRKFNLSREVEKTVDPTGEVSEEAAGLDRDARKAARGEDDEPESEEKAPSESAEKETGDEPAEGRARWQHQPAQVAPPHSVRPPTESDEGQDEPSEPTTAGRGSKKSNKKPDPNKIQKSA
jgi:sec-independent protein translocase protein TatB